MKNAKIEPLQRLHIVVVAYGDWHLNLFEKILVPNLQGLVSEIPEDLREETILKVFTRKENESFVKEKLEKAKLEKLIKIKILPEVSPPSDNNPYPEMNRMHQVALEDSIKENAGMFFMFPDQILSKGTLATILRAVKDGARLITFPSIRIKMEPLLPLLEEKVKKSKEHWLYEEPRTLVKMVLPHFHQLLKDMFWTAYDQPEVSAAHYAVMWDVGERGIMARGFHNYVAFAWPTVRKAGYSYSIDVHFIKQGFKNFDQVYMVDDSDSAFAFDLSNEERRHLGKMAAASKAERLLRVADNRDMFTDFHLRTTLAICRIHTGDFDDVWRKEEKKFDEATTHIFVYILFKRFLLSRKRAVLKIRDKIKYRMQDFQTCMRERRQKWRDRVANARGVTKSLLVSSWGPALFANPIGRGLARKLQAKTPPKN